jgi:hypothetical protein
MANRRLALAGEAMTLHQSHYTHGGGIALTVVADDGVPFLTLTTNIEQAPLRDGEFCVKVWSENEPYIADILASGLFVDTGRRVVAGFTEAHVWRLK